MDRDSINIVIIAVIFFAALLAVSFFVIKYASGELQTVEVIQIDDRTRCIVVSRGTHVSIDCISEKSDGN